MLIVRPMGYLWRLAMYEAERAAGDFLHKMKIMAAIFMNRAAKYSKL